MESVPALTRSSRGCGLHNATSCCASCWQWNWNFGKREGTFCGRKSITAGSRKLRNEIESIFQRVVKRNRLGDYELHGELGHGAMGLVYKARQINLNQTVALKVLSERYLNEPQAIARFKREMQSIGGLEHPNIVRAYNAGEAGGAHFLAMEYVEGIDLQHLVRPNATTNRPLSVGAACEAIRQLALGLQHAHKHGIVHRDVKPANSMLSRTGVVKLLDLGLAKLHAERTSPEQDTDGLTQTGITMGTIDYMAPEQWDDPGGVDIRADIYSLGCTLYFLLAGKAPYRNTASESNRKKIMAHIAGPIPSLAAACPDCPPELQEVFERMLAKSQADRFQTPAEVAKAMAPFAAMRDLAQLAASLDRGDQSTADSEPAIKSSEIETGETALPPWRTPTPVSGLQQQRQRRLRLSILAAAVTAAVVLLAVAAFLYNRWRSRPPPFAAHQNNLLLLPGLTGNWWFDEMPWYTPFVRQAMADAIARSDDPSSFLGGKSEFYFDTNTIAVQKKLREIVEKSCDSLSKPQQQLLKTLKDISDSDRTDAELAIKLEKAIERFENDHKGSQWPAVDRHTLACLQHKLSTIHLYGAAGGSSNQRHAEDAKKNYDLAYGQYAAESGLWRLCCEDSALLYSSQLDDYAKDGKARFGDAIRGDNVPPLFKAATLIDQGGEAATHAHSGEEYDLQAFDEAEKILQLIQNENSSFENHPLVAIVYTSRAWVLMDQWKIEDARKEFEKAKSILETNRKRNPALNVEYYHTRHGLAIASRYQGNLANVGSEFSELVGDTYSGGKSKGDIMTTHDSITDSDGRQHYKRDLTERWANSRGALGRLPALRRRDFGQRRRSALRRGLHAVQTRPRRGAGSRRSVRHELQVLYRYGPQWPRGRRRQDLLRRGGLCE